MVVFAAILALKYSHHSVTNSLGTYDISGYWPNLKRGRVAAYVHDWVQFSDKADNKNPELIARQRCCLCNDVVCEQVSKIAKGV